MNIALEPEEIMVTMPASLACFRKVWHNIEVMTGDDTYFNIDFLSRRKY